MAQRFDYCSDGTKRNVTELPSVDILCLLPDWTSNMGEPSWIKFKLKPGTYKVKILGNNDFHLGASVSLELFVETNVTFPSSVRAHQPLKSDRIFSFQALLPETPKFHHLIKEGAVFIVNGVEKSFTNEIEFNFESRKVFMLENKTVPCLDQADHNLYEGEEINLIYNKDEMPKPSYYDYDLGINMIII